MTESREARPEEFKRLNGHAPGVIYNVSQVRKRLDLISSRLQNGNVVAKTYPQVLLSIDLMLNGGKCWFFAGAFVEEGGALPSGIKDASGQHYAQLSSRIQQLAAFDTVISSYPPSPNRDEMLRSSRRAGILRCFKADKQLFEGIMIDDKPGLGRRIARKFRSQVRKIFGDKGIMRGGSK